MNLKKSEHDKLFEVLFEYMDSSPKGLNLKDIIEIINDEDIEITSADLETQSGRVKFGMWLSKVRNLIHNPTKENSELLILTSDSTTSRAYRRRYKIGRPCCINNNDKSQCTTLPTKPIEAKGIIYYLCEEHMKLYKKVAGVEE